MNSTSFTTRSPLCGNYQTISKIAKHDFFLLNVSSLKRAKMCRVCDSRIFRNELVANTISIHFLGFGFFKTGNVFEKFSYIFTYHYCKMAYEGFNLYCHVFSNNYYNLCLEMKVILAEGYVPPDTTIHPNINGEVNPRIQRE